MPVIVDLLDRLDSSTVIRENRVVEPGNADHRSFLGEGWGRPEKNSDSERSYAWVTAPTARVKFVRLHSGAARIVVKAWPFRWRGSPPQEVELIVNGRSVGSRTMRRGRQNLNYDVPQGVFFPGGNTVDFSFSYAKSPAEVNPKNRDARELAAAFERIEVRDGQVSDASAFPGGPFSTDGGGLRLSQGSALSYRVMPVGEVALDVEVAADSDQSATPPRIVLWVTPVGGEPVCVVDEVIPEAGLRRRMWLDQLSGQRLDVSMTVLGGAGTIGRARLVGNGRVDATKNVVMIVIDTLRADHVGAYGGEVYTPAIDRLAADGILFEQAYAHIPITGPSHSSLFTSLLPFEHGVHNNGQILAQSWKTLAETLQGGGWHTFAAVSLGVLKRELGYKQGFEVYLDSFDRDWMKDAGEITDEVLELAETGLSAPFFLFVHYSDPHEPYTPPGLDYPMVRLDLDGLKVAEIAANGRGNRISVEVPPGHHNLRFAPQRQTQRRFRVDTLRVIGKGVEVDSAEGWEVDQHFRRKTATYASRFPATLVLANDGREPRGVELDFTLKEHLSVKEVKGRYRQEVEFADRQIGRLLAGLEERGLMRDTIIVFTSDHGEGLGQHKHLSHIHQLYDTLIRVPLIVTLPNGDHAGLRISQRASFVDVFPTLAEMLGVETPVPSSGTSLVPFISRTSSESMPVFAETYRPEAYSDKRAIISGRYKFIHSWSDEREWEELYDLEADPDELVDLFAEEPEIADRLRFELLERMRTATQGKVEEADLSQQDLDRLRALGYVH